MMPIAIFPGDKVGGRFRHPEGRKREDPDLDLLGVDHVDGAETPPPAGDTTLGGTARERTTGRAIGCEVDPACPSTGSDRDRAASAGVEIATDNGDLARRCGVIVLCLPHPDASRAAVDAIVDHGREGTDVFDTSTLSPLTARELHERAAEAGIHYFDSPITGGEVGASRGELTVMIGGDPERIEAHEDVLTTIAEAVYDDKLDSFFSNEFPEAFDEHFAIGDDAGSAGNRFELNVAHKDLVELTDLADEHETYLPLGNFVEQFHREGMNAGYGDRPHPDLLQLYADLFDVDVESRAERRQKSEGRLF